MHWNDVLALRDLSWPVLVFGFPGISMRRYCSADEFMQAWSKVRYLFLRRLARGTTLLLVDADGKVGGIVVRQPKWHIGPIRDAWYSALNPVIKVKYFVVDHYLRMSLQELQDLVCSEIHAEAELWWSVDHPGRMKERVRACDSIREVASLPFFEHTPILPDTRGEG